MVEPADAAHARCVESNESRPAAKALLWTVIVATTLVIIPIKLLPMTEYVPPWIGWIFTNGKEVLVALAMAPLFCPLKYRSRDACRCACEHEAVALTDDILRRG